MPYYTLRSCQLEDIPALMTLRNNAAQHSQFIDTQCPIKLSKALHHYISEYGQGWLCFDKQKEKIIGYIIASKKESSIWALYVDPTNQKNGIGQHLLSTAEHWLFQHNNAMPLYLSTEYNNVPAITFYEKNNWQKKSPINGDLSKYITLSKSSLAL